MHRMAALEQSVREAVGLQGPCLSKSAELDVEVDTVEISARLCRVSELSEEEKVILEEPVVAVKQIEHEPQVPEELQALVEADDNLLQCPSCNNVWECIGSGFAADCDVYDAQGKEVVNEEALQAFHEHRQRCRHCSTTFCKSCKASPFHTGITCSVHTGAVIYKDCRFCRKQLAEKVEAAVQQEESLEEEVELPVSNDAVEGLSMAKRALLLGEQLRSKGYAAATPSGFRPIQGVCADFDCQQKLEAVCEKVLSCGHYCAEDVKHTACGSCLHPGCVEADAVSLDDFCSICWVEDLRTAAVTRLGCGHVFHTDCVISRLVCKWGAGAINLSYASCPLCSNPLQWSGQNNDITQALRMAERLRSDLVLRAQVLIDSKIVAVPDDVPASEAAAHALTKVNFYTCFQCKSAYYGGKVECGVPPLEVAASEYICGGCIGCKKHGDRDLIYKCKFCCSIATFFCFGNTHFCEPCHDRWTTMVDRNNYAMLADEAALKGCCKETCPLGIEHPPNGEEHLIGCRLCFDKVEGPLDEDPSPGRRGAARRMFRRRNMSPVRRRRARSPPPRPPQRGDDFARRKNDAAVPNVQALRFVGAAAKADPLAALKAKLQRKRLGLNAEPQEAPAPAEVLVPQAPRPAVMAEEVAVKAEEKEDAVKAEKLEVIPDAERARLVDKLRIDRIYASESDSDEELYPNDSPVREAKMEAPDRLRLYFDMSDESDLEDLYGDLCLGEGEQQEEPAIQHDGDDDRCDIYGQYYGSYLADQEDLEEGLPKEEFNALAEVLRLKVEERRIERLAEEVASDEGKPFGGDDEPLGGLAEPLADEPAAGGAAVEAAAVEVAAEAGDAAEAEPFVARVRAARQFWEKVAQ